MAAPTSAATLKTAEVVQRDSRFRCRVVEDA
jgi:hypothetical protein